MLLDVLEHCQLSHLFAPDSIYTTVVMHGLQCFGVLGALDDAPDGINLITNSSGSLKDVIHLISLSVLQELHAAHSLGCSFPAAYGGGRHSTRMSRSTPSWTSATRPGGRSSTTSGTTSSYQVRGTSCGVGCTVSPWCLHNAKVHVARWTSQVLHTLSWNALTCWKHRSVTSVTPSDQRYWAAATDVLLTSFLPAKTLLYQLVL